MSLIREDGLTNLQNDLRWPLLADDYFTDIPVLDYRKENIESEVQKILSPLAGKGGKVGASVIVLPLAAQDGYRDGSIAHPLTCTVTYRVLENPLFNNGTNGTRKAALSICSRIRRVLKHYIAGGYAASGLVPDAESFITPVEDPIAPVAYEVAFTCLEGTDQAVVKTANCVFDYDDVTGMMAILNDTPDVTIYYTLDGTFPYTSAGAPNASAIQYTAPFQMEGEWFIRAAGYAPGRLPGNVNALRSTDLSDQTGGGGSIGGLN